MITMSQAAPATLSAPNNSHQNTPTPARRLKMTRLGTVRMRSSVVVTLRGWFYEGHQPRIRQMEPATGSRRPRVVKRLLVMASVLALFACGTPAGEVGSSAGTSTTLQTAVPTSFPSCADVPFTRAADDHYSVTPLYIANEMPIDEVRSWAEFQPGFEELWIDRERNGWLTLGFTEGVADAQAAVSREFPGVGVVVVEVPFTLQELMDLHGGIREVLLEETENFASGISVHKGVVEMNVAILTDEIRQVMEEHFVGEPICLDGGDASDYPEPAPQPLEGDGWRILVHEPEV